ncbi:MAG: hypothetical protein Q7V14_06825 [Coriobacteriia bacterium]|nr:hypothetical protein [Coriobacteriia bacterium]
MVTSEAVPSGFDAIFQKVVYYAGPILQISLWIVMMVAAIYAVVLFKRLVDFQTGAKKAAEADAVAPEADNTKKDKKSDAIRVEDFVE